MQRPSVGRIVHYVSHGTPVRADGSQAYRSECRAAVITAVPELSPGNQAQADAEHWPVEVSLCVLNPTGVFFHESVPYHAGGATPGDPDCRNPHEDGPMRYCPCGWTEATYPGGTWHWPERV